MGLYWAYMKVVLRIYWGYIGVTLGLASGLQYQWAVVPLMGFVC